MDFGLMATAACGVVVGGVIGCVLTGIGASSKVADLEAEVAHWNRLWERDNNRIAAFREKAKKIMVPVRGSKGRLKGQESVLTRINGLLSLEGRGHDAL